MATLSLLCSSEFADHEAAFATCLGHAVTMPLRLMSACSNQRDALVASRCPPAGPKMALWTYRSMLAPPPDEINWSDKLQIYPACINLFLFHVLRQTLWTKSSVRYWRSKLMQPFLVIAIIFPIGVITGMQGGTFPLPSVCYNERLCGAGGLTNLKLAACPASPPSSSNTLIHGYSDTVKW